MATPGLEFHRTNKKYAPPLRVIYMFVVRLFLISTIINSDVAAKIICHPGDPSNGDALCAQKYRPGSFCVPSVNMDANVGNTTEGGTCSNPFQSGCLQNYLGKETFRHARVCNSDDDDGAADRGECEDSPFDYEEVRILNQVRALVGLFCET